MKRKLFGPGLVTIMMFAQMSAAAAGPPSESALAKGRRAYERGDYASALDLAKEAQRASPGDLDVFELWARANMAVGQPRAALGPLAQLVSRRGLASDYRLQAAALKMSGRLTEAGASLLKAASAERADAADLYALSWTAPDAASRASLLKRLAASRPDLAAAAGAEAAFWEKRGATVLRQAAAPPPGGVEVPLKTLYDLEWAVVRSGSGEEIWLLFDTACRETVLSDETAKKLGLETVTGALPPAGAYADESAHTYAVVDSLDLGGYKVANVPVLVCEAPTGLLKYREGRVVCKGILGMDLLEGLQATFDRKKNVLRLLPPDAPRSTLLEGKTEEWTELPAFDVDGQVMVPASLGDQPNTLALLSTGCTLTLASGPALEPTGLKVDGRKTVTLGPGASYYLPGQAVGTAMSRMDRVQGFPLGWMDVCLPPPGTVRVVPKTSPVGFGTAVFQAPDLPVYPRALGGSVPASLVVGKQITDFYTIALDLPHGRMFTKKVLFN